jgi:beta-N-acetylhexosaminidase
MLMKYNVDRGNAAIKKLTQKITDFVAEKTGVPPFIAIDHEGGLVHRFGAGVSRLPAPGAYFKRLQNEGAAKVADEIAADSEHSGRELRALGITFNLAPVAETRTVENARFLGSRSYGSDPDFTALAAESFVRGMQRAGVACAVKHFPGNTSVDPHQTLPVLLQSADVLSRELKSFAATIQAAPAAVMLSHVVVPAWEKGVNASLSRVAVEKLRGEYGFRGIIIADDFAMKAIRLPVEEASIRAIAAGVDMVMVWPGSLHSVHQALLGALRSGRISRQTMEDAARRIIAEKLRFNLVGALT